MKLAFAMVVAASVGLTAGAMSPVAAGTGTTEIGYTKNSLAVADLNAGRLNQAERILAAQSAEDAQDPARLINLGIVYARSGRISEARTAFIAASRAHEPLILSDGREVSSNIVAREQLALLDRASIAAR